MSSNSELIGLDISAKGADLKYPSNIPVRGYDNDKIIKIIYLSMLIYW